jgi:TatD DNase family protein
MRIVDTHCHLYSKDFDEDRAEVIARSIRMGVDRILLPNVDLDTVDGMHDLMRDYPEICYGMVGLHPCDVGEDWERELSVLLSLSDTHTYCAVGEIGIDLYWDKTTLDIQKIAFQRQIQLAKQHKLAINIHCRDAFDEVFEVLESLLIKSTEIILQLMNCIFLSFSL